MGCRGWQKRVVLLCAGLMISCGGTGGGPSDSGKPLVFQTRGRLTLAAVVTTEDPTVLTLLATLLDPQGNPFRNQRVTFAAGFNDVTFLPQDRNPATCDPVSCSNRGAAFTDDNGRVQVTLIAGLTTGNMRIIAEAPPALNLAAGITVTITKQGFISLGPLGIIPSTVTFINPLVGPGVPGPMTIFNAVGGTPPYRWNNSNKDLGEIAPTGLPNINETAEYTLTGPIPTDQVGALQDTVRLLDADGSQATAAVTVIFADCKLKADGTKVTIIGAPGAQFQVDVSDGVPPFSITETFPGSVIAEVLATDKKGNVIPESEECDGCLIRFTVPDPPVAVDPDTILIRDARGCTASIELTVTLCGNGVKDPGEECDLNDFGSLTSCEDLLGTGATGILSCTNNCTIDTSKCTPAQSPSS